MIDFCVLGSGIAGSTISNLLAKKNVVKVFDKAKGIGGRASNRRYKHKLCFDHGLQYISPKDPFYKKFINELKKKKVLKTWSGNHLDFSLEKKPDEPKFIGKNSNNDISKYLLRNIKKEFSSPITKIIFEKNFWKLTVSNKQIYCKNLILTCPFPQVTLLANKYLDKKIKKLNVKMEPNITVMAVFRNNHIPISSLKFDNKIISWASNENSKKRFNSNLNLWTIQCSLSYSKKIINSFKQKKSFFSSEVIKEFSKITGINNKDLIYKNIHGWKYSYNYNKTTLKSYWNKKFKIGLCGDWFNGPKAESAWISAKDLFNKIKKK